MIPIDVMILPMLYVKFKSYPRTHGPRFGGWKIVMWGTLDWSEGGVISYSFPIIFHLHENWERNKRMEKKREKKKMMKRKKNSEFLYITRGEGQLSCFKKCAQGVILPKIIWLQLSTKLEPSIVKVKKKKKKSKACPL